MGGTKIPDVMSKCPDLTAEETDRLTKAFKDPKFLELFADYAREISDPRAKTEQEAYLQELEREGRSQEVYGKGVELVAPDPWFVVKTKETSGNQTVYINVCTSKKVAPLKLTASSNASRPGMQLDLPNMLGSQQKFKNGRDQECTAWDFVVHPSAMQHMAAKPAFQETLVEMAMEQVEKAAGLQLLKKFKVMNSKYKGSQGQERPSVLALRQAGNEGVVVGGRLAPKAAAATATLSSSPGSQQHAYSSPLPSASPSCGTEAASAAEPQNGSFARQSTDSTWCHIQQQQEREHAGGAHRWGLGVPAGFLNRNKSWPIGHAPQDPKQPGYQHPDGSLTPSYELVHRGTAELTDAWGDVGRRIPSTSRAPKELVLRVNMPGVSSSATLTLEIGTKNLLVHVPNSFLLNLPLNYEVEKGKSSAKFDTTKQQLIVTMPVLAAPLPAAATAPAIVSAAAAQGSATALVQSAAVPSTTHSAPFQQSAGSQPSNAANATTGAQPAPAAVLRNAIDASKDSTVSDTVDAGEVSSLALVQSSASAATAADDLHCSRDSSELPRSPGRERSATGERASSLEHGSSREAPTREGSTPRTEADATPAAPATEVTHSSSQRPSLLPGKSAAQLQWEQLHADHDKRLAQQQPQRQGPTAEGVSPVQNGAPGEARVGSKECGVRSSSSLASGSSHGGSPRQEVASPRSSPRSSQAKVRAAAAKLMPRLLGARKQAEMLD